MTAKKSLTGNIKTNSRLNGWHIQNIFVQPDVSVPETEAPVESNGYDDMNKTLFHTFQKVTQVEFTCDLPGCRDRFEVDLYPGQFIYPKFCEKHRSEYQRVNFPASCGLTLAG